MNSASVARSAAAFAFALSLAACSAQPLSYEAKARFAKAEARSLIERAFEDQPRDFRPLGVEVTGDAIKLGVVSFKSAQWTSAVAAVQETETYYFARLSEPALFYKRGTWRVRLDNLDRTMGRWVIFTSERRASEFLDAIQSMRSQ